MVKKKEDQDTPLSDEPNPESNDKNLIENNYLALGTATSKEVSEWLKNLRNVETHISTTGTQIGSTLGTLDALSESMKEWNRNAITGLQPGLDDYFTQRIEPIKNELESKLQETKKSLSNMNAFIKDNESALTSLFSVQGKMTGLESQVSSILGRLTKLEDDRNINWNKTTTIISIIIAIISIATAAYFAFK